MTELAANDGPLTGMHHPVQRLKLAQFAHCFGDLMQIFRRRFHQIVIRESGDRFLERFPLRLVERHQFFFGIHQIAARFDTGTPDFILQYSK